MLDVVVRNGTVVDGSGRPRRRADVGVEHGRIAALGRLDGAVAARELDAEGLIVAPGFIDIHSHSDFTLLVDPRAQSQVAQGVTTEVIGNCGHGCAPISDPQLVKPNIYGYSPLVDLDWVSVDGYLQRLEQAGPAVNVLTLVPNGNLRLAAVGIKERPATGGELERMTRLLEEGLEEGAFGLSTGLEYPAERACSAEELTSLCRVVAGVGGIYATHTRNRDLQAVESIDEGIGVAERSGVRLQVSHIIPRRAGDDSSWERALELVDAALARGVDLAFDAHTRLQGITNLSNVLPAADFSAAPQRLRQRLSDPGARAEMKRHQSLISSFSLAGWENVYLFSSERCPQMVGHSFAELAPAGGDAFDAIYEVLLAEADDPHGPMCICACYQEESLRATFRHPLCMPGSDATALCPQGPLAGATFLGAYTWASWYFRRLVRELGDLTLEDAVRKLTSLPADRIGLRRRGRIEAGAWADLAVFDPSRFGETGTLEAPNSLAVGMVHVLVNGELAMEAGEFTGRRDGRVLRRGDDG